MRLRDFRVSRGQLVDQLLHRFLVAFPTQHPIEMHQVGGEVGFVLFEQLGELRNQIIDAIGQYQQGRFGLPGARRVGFDLEPHPRQFQRQIVLFGSGGNFDGTRDHRRVAGAAGEVGPGADAEFGVAALQRQVGEQRLKDGTGKHVFRAVGCCGRRLAGRLFCRAFIGSVERPEQGTGKGGENQLL